MLKDGDMDKGKEENKDEDEDSVKNNNNDGDDDEDKDKEDDDDVDENGLPGPPWVVRTRCSLLFPENKYFSSFPPNLRICALL